MKRIAFSREIISEKERVYIKNYLENILSVDTSSINLSLDKLVKTCFNDFCIIFEDRGFNDLNTIFKGRWVAGIVNEKIFISPWLYDIIYKQFGRRACIVVDGKGLEVFLYGEDLFASSIKEYYEPIDNDVAVLDYRDDNVLGVAKPLVKGHELKKLIKEGVNKPVFKNIFDLGIYIRLVG